MMKELNRLLSLEKTILKAIAQTKTLGRLEKCDYTQSILDNLRAALTRCEQSLEIVRKELTESLNK